MANLQIQDTMFMLVLIFMLAIVAKFNSTVLQIDSRYLRID